MAEPPREPARRRFIARDRLLALLRPSEAPLDLRILGRTLWHAAMVGLGAGLIGAAFFASLAYLERVLIEEHAGYITLRAHGEYVFRALTEHVPFRWWLLLFLPGLGALLGGLLTRLAPETRGGGSDQMLNAFHHQGGVIRARVIWVKWFASLFTLGTGGSGGREGPIMQIGAAIGSTVGRTLKVSARERRILMVAGVGAGMAAVFRTPLGAALLAVEMLYRDDFESDALIPAILASVVAYSVVIGFFGESVLFAHAPRYPFYAGHLPLYGLEALLVALVAALFTGTLHKTHDFFHRLKKIPGWVQPGIGGLLLGLLTVPVILWFGHRIGVPGQGIGILGGGYGAAQISIVPPDWLPGGWLGVELLLLLCGAKLIASCLTLGSGGSAGDFAPSLVLGAIFGGAFGRAAQLLLHDPRIDPGAFALVGMGTFYGGIAHVPVSSLIMVCELAGSYDLLVPLMLAEGIAYVALRRYSLYRAQLPSKSASPAHPTPEALQSVRVADVLVKDREYVRFGLTTSAAEILRRVPDNDWQDSFPVLDDDGRLRGLITAEA
ncbi:MAG: chloride channel protein, partial [Polyangia bacterium]